MEKLVHDELEKWDVDLDWVREEEEEVKVVKKSGGLGKMAAGSFL